jgi:eukaryotic-like serine/threonine-protein kinase
MSGPKDTLFSTLPPEVHEDAERLLATEPDPRDLVAALHKQGLLDAGQLKKAVLALEAELPISQFKRKPPEEQSHRIMGVLGAGAMGEVLIAKDPGLNRIVAVKRLFPEGAKRKSMLRRFYKEAQVTAQLDHPCIVPIHGLVDIGDGTLAYAMKLVRGRTLEDYFEEAKEMWNTSGGPGPSHNLSARLERFLHVCDAMAYAHERGILHRDLKPENVMVGTFGEVLVMDWGIAKILAERDEPEPDEGEEEVPQRRKIKGTRVGTVMGTPKYMSPEQAFGRTDTMDARSDQYALGLILYETVSLQAATKSGISLEESVEWAEKARKLPLEHYAGEHIARELGAIIDKATAAKPEDRYADVTLMAEDVRRYLRDEAPVAKPDNVFQKLHRWVGRHRSLMLTAVFSLILLVGCVGTSTALMGLGGVQYSMHRAAVHEEDLAQVLQYVIKKGHKLDSELDRVEGLATGLSFSAQHALENPTRALPWDPLVDVPPGLSGSDFYGHDLSVDWPEFRTGRGVAALDHRDQLTALASLGPRFHEALAQSSPKRGRSSNDTARLIRGGAPLLWARIGLREGLVAAFPGGRKIDQGVGDPPKEPWFRDAVKGKHGAAWIGPRSVKDAIDLALTCSVPWRNDAGKVQGVASVDLGLEHLQRYLTPNPPDTETSLVDSEGRIIARSGESTLGQESWQETPFHHPEIWEQMESNTVRGYHETAAGLLAVWVPVNSIDAFLVMTGPSEAFLTRLHERAPE